MHFHSDWFQIVCDSWNYLYREQSKKYAAKWGGGLKKEKPKYLRLIHVVEDGHRFENIYVSHIIRMDPVS